MRKYLEPGVVYKEAGARKSFRKLRPAVRFYCAIVITVQLFSDKGCEGYRQIFLESSILHYLKQLPKLFTLF